MKITTTFIAVLCIIYTVHAQVTYTGIYNSTLSINITYAASFGFEITVMEYNFVKEGTVITLDDYYVEEDTLVFLAITVINIDLKRDSMDGLLWNTFTPAMNATIINAPIAQIMLNQTNATISVPGGFPLPGGLPLPGGSSWPGGSPLSGLSGGLSVSGGSPLDMMSLYGGAGNLLGSMPGLSK
jgi:hypothetical protein